MENWLELEARFRALAPTFQGVRLDDQTGSAGEHWMLAAAPRHTAVAEFEGLCRIAGGLLKRLASDDSLYSDLASHDDPKICWYRAMKHLAGAHEQGIVAFHTSVDGDDLGPIVTGSIYNVPQTAANLCLFLQDNMPVPAPRAPESSIWRKIYDDFGKKIIGAVLVFLALAGVKVLFGL